MTLNPIIAPLSREVGLAERQVGVTISTAAVMVVLTSQSWGRHSTTGLVTGGALLAAGLGMILAQAIIVPRSGWTPLTLLRVGAVVAFARLRPDRLCVARDD